MVVALIYNVNTKNKDALDLFLESNGHGVTTNNENADKGFIFLTLINAVGIVHLAY